MRMSAGAESSSSSQSHCACPKKARDVSVVGYDDVPLASWAAYDLTTIRQPVEAMVDATVEALVRRIEGETEPRKVRLPGPLIIRGSARLPEGAVRSPDPIPRGET